MDHNKHLAEILTSLRQERGIYQKEIAVYLKVSVGTISNYEKGIHQPDLDTLCRLADFFGVSTDYLLGRTTYPYTNLPSSPNEKICTKCLKQLSGAVTEMSPDNIHTLELSMEYLIKFLQNHEVSVKEKGV